MLYFSDTYGPEDVNVISVDVIDQIWLPILLTVGFGLPDVPKFQQNKTAIFVNGLLPEGKKAFLFKKNTILLNEKVLVLHYF